MHADFWFRLYGGMVELPLIVTRDDGARWFADRDFLTGGRLWAEAVFRAREKSHAAAGNLVHGKCDP